MVAGRGGDVDRLEGQLAEALSAESRARAELIEEQGARNKEASSLAAALDAASKKNAELQARLANVEDENEKLLHERDVSFRLFFPVLLKLLMY